MSTWTWWTAVIGGLYLTYGLYRFIRASWLRGGFTSIKDLIVIVLWPWFLDDLRDPK